VENESGLNGQFSGRAWRTRHMDGEVGMTKRKVVKLFKSGVADKEGTK
jgi:hypothetical protein